METRDSGLPRLDLLRRRHAGPGSGCPEKRAQCEQHDRGSFGLDHGWHLGEKEHWQKVYRLAGLLACSLIVRVPKGAPGLPAGTKPSRCSSRSTCLVSLLPCSNYRDFPPPKCTTVRALFPCWKIGKIEWPHVSLTHLHHPGSFGLSGEGWRYIRYADGGEELYEIEKDPYEWNNLAGDKKVFEKS